MNVPEFVRLLKQKNMDSEVWWDSSPTLYASFKHSLRAKYSDMCGLIDNMLPDLIAPNVYGFSGATTNPRLISEAVLKNPQVWHRYIDGLPVGLSAEDKAGQVYDQMIVEGARLLLPLWISSERRHGWFSAQIEGGETMDEESLVARGLKLARLAPNIMIKVPGSEPGYRAIEHLVAQGCSINNTFCFTVSQVAACLKAIHDGQLRARLQGVETERARYVISFMIGRLGAPSQFREQAARRGLNLTAADRRWSEIAVYQAMHALLRRRETPARLLLCSLKVDIDSRGREQCWHLQRTGSETTLYTLTPQIIEFLVRRQKRMQPVTPASGWLQIPKRVLDRLTAMPYFNQAYFEGGLAPSEFASHPAFITAGNDARAGQESLLAFVKSAGGATDVSSSRPLCKRMVERAS